MKFPGKDISFPTYRVRKTQASSSVLDKTTRKVSYFNIRIFRKAQQTKKGKIKTNMLHLILTYTWIQHFYLFISRPSDKSILAYAL